MPVFSCRWPNGDLSFASACNKEDAVDLLDEVGDASGAELRVVREFMVHFHLAGDGASELEGFRKVSNEAVGTAYPLLCEAEINPAAPSDRKRPARSARGFTRNWSVSNRRLARPQRHSSVGTFKPLPACPCLKSIASSSRPAARCCSG